MPQHTANCGRYSRTVVVVAEHTPNPDAIKFLLGRALVSEARDYASADSGSTSPLAEALFHIAGVRRVFLGPDFVVVTKSSDAAWAALADPVQRVLREFLASGHAAVDPDAPAPARASGGEAEARLVRVLREQIEPIVAAHGGEVELVSYLGGVARLALHGACSGCPAAELTLRAQVERRLRAELPELVRVEQA
jgi:Fe-S cluster biogenesis protein NfuA